MTIPQRVSAASAAAMPRIDLAITACEGREHLLLRTVQSFREASNFRFRRTILVVDGVLDPAAIAAVAPDLVVQNWRRSGYVVSIINFAKVLEGDAFFWLEDDWSCRRPIDFERLSDALAAHDDWVQIRLSKSAPLTADERTTPLGNGFFESAWGFSANPSLNRTRYLKAVVAALENAPKERLVGFETFFSRWFAERGLRCVVDDPGESAAVEHEGYLESTPRQFHMLASLDGVVAEHLSGIGVRTSPVRRLAMAAKLLLRAVSLGLKLLRSDAAFETAFRIVTLPIPNDVAPAADAGKPR